MPPGAAGWGAQARAPAPHVVDGRFTAGEWEHAIRLEGLLTDVYLDYEPPHLFVLNDWRANVMGVRPDCFNSFRLRIGGVPVEVRVFGSGRIEVERSGHVVAGDADGAYGFHPSPMWATPHTIWEFSLDIGRDARSVDVCCLDPVTMSTCEELVEEPMVVSLRVEQAGVRVARRIPETVVVRPVGASCGRRQGICTAGAACVERDGEATCEGPRPPAVTRDAASDPFDRDAGADAEPPI